jgi:hypothetical protein
MLVIEKTAAVFCFSAHILLRQEQRRAPFHSTLCQGKREEDASKSENPWVRAAAIEGLGHVPEPLRTPASAATAPRAAGTKVVPGGRPGDESAKLRYGWKPGQSYLYRVTIEVGAGGETETRFGDVTYKVDSVKDGQTTLSFSGLLGYSYKATPGIRSRPFSRPYPPFPRTSRTTMPAGPQAGKVTLDPFGRVTKHQGSSQLPFLLGDLSVVVIEPLSETGNNSWRVARDIEVSFRKDELPFPRTPPLGEPREAVPATETIDYSLEEAGEKLVTITKRYEAKTAATIDGQPILEMVGTGTWKFNRELGVPASLDCRIEATCREANLTTSASVKVAYHLLDEAEKAAIARAVEEARLKRLQPLTRQELDNLATDLESGGHDPLLRALQTLGERDPKEPDPRVAKALESVLLHNSNAALRIAAANDLKTWSTPASVPALIQAVDDAFPPVRGAAMDALIKYRPASAIEPVAARLVDLADRTNAGKFLRALGPDAEDAVLKYADHADRWTRLEVFETLTVIGTAKSLPALEKGAQDTDWHVRKVADQALAAVKQRQSKQSKSEQ